MRSAVAERAMATAMTGARWTLSSAAPSFVGRRTELGTRGGWMRDKFSQWPRDGCN